MSILYVFGYVDVVGRPHKDAGSTPPDAEQMANSPVRLMGWETSSSIEASSCAEASQSGVDFSGSC